MAPPNFDLNIGVQEDEDVDLTVWHEEDIIDLTAGVQEEEDEDVDLTMGEEPHQFDLNSVPEEVVAGAEIDLNTVPDEECVSVGGGVANEIDLNIMHVEEKADSNGGNQNRKKKRFYPDDLKVAIYLDLLAKTDPPVLRRGVSKAVALKFDVPLRVVQSVWYNGQKQGGIEGVKNKRSLCGRKKAKIDPEAIKTLALAGLTTLPGLANKLGVSKSTLHRRLKEGLLLHSAGLVCSSEPSSTATSSQLYQHRQP